MKHLVVWAGPISASDLPASALPADASVLTLNEGDGGIGSSAFARLGARFPSVRVLCARYGVDLDEAETLTLASFSAGWGLLEHLFRDPETLSRLSAVLCADNYYTGAALTPKPGYLEVVRRAVAGELLGVFSTSGFAGPGYPSSDRAFFHLTEPFEPLSEVPAPAGLPLSDARGLLPAPVETLARGGLVWCRYGTRIPHPSHGSRLARVLMRGLVAPYLERRTSPLSQPPLDALAGLGLALGAMVLT